MTVGHNQNNIMMGQLSSLNTVGLSHIPTLISTQIPIIILRVYTKHDHQHDMLVVLNGEAPLAASRTSPLTNAEGEVVEVFVYCCFM